MFNYKLTICVCLQKTFRPLFLSTSTSSLVVATLFAQATSDIGVFVCAEFTPAPDSSIFWAARPHAAMETVVSLHSHTSVYPSLQEDLSLEHLLYNTFFVQFAYLTSHDVLIALMFNETKISTCMRACTDSMFVATLNTCMLSRQEKLDD